MVTLAAADSGEKPHSTLLLFPDEFPSIGEVVVGDSRVNLVNAVEVVTGVLEFTACPTRWIHGLAYS